MSQSIPTWYPQHPPIYDIKKTYQENFDAGPLFDGAIPQRDLTNKSGWINFLGHQVASPIGVAAGPLLNSKYINLAAKLGFDIVTFKTIRSKKHLSHPLPNVVYTNAKGQLNSADLAKPVTILSEQPANVEQLTFTKLYGVDFK